MLINTSIIIIDLSCVWNSIGSMHLLPGSLLLVLFFYIALLSAVCFLFLIIKLCLKTLKIIKALYLPFVIFVFFKSCLNEIVLLIIFKLFIYFVPLWSIMLFFKIIISFIQSLERVFSAFQRFSRCIKYECHFFYLWKIISSKSDSNSCLFFWTCIQMFLMLCFVF